MSFAGCTPIDCFQYDKDTMTLLNSVIGNLFLIIFVE